MSIVLAVATPSVAVLKCDGRECSHEGIVINEQCQKFSVVGEHCAVGYTGTVELIVAVLDKAVAISKEWGYSSNTLTVTRFSEICQRILAENEAFISRFAKPVINLVFVGLEENKIVLKSLGTGSNYEVLDRTPTEANQISYFSLVSDFANGAIPFHDFYDKSKSLTDNMDNYIKYISTIDFSVNTNISTAVLERKKSMI